MFKRINQPCLARIICAVPPTEDDGPVIYTEYFEGGSLATYFNSNAIRCMTATERVIVTCGIVLGLLALHSANLYHGNLKPSDILLDSDLNIHITDYVSHALENVNYTYSGTNARPHWSAPEYGLYGAWNFDINDPNCVGRLQKSDIFALGLIIFEILTGQPVINRHLTAAEVRRKTQDDIDRPRIPGYIHNEFAQVIKRCWSAKPDERHLAGEVWLILKGIRYRIFDGVDVQEVAARVAPWEP